jgi:hypothetical protein
MQTEGLKNEMDRMRKIRRAAGKATTRQDLR